MTVQTTTNRTEYTGNGTTTAFPVSFVFLESTDLYVYVDGVLKTLTTDYTVTGGDGAVGTVTFNSAPAADAAIVIVRVLQATQELDLANGGAFNADVIEQALDKLTMLIQRAEDRLDGALGVADYISGGVNVQLPTPEAGKLIGWNADADGLTNYNAAEVATALSTGNWTYETFSGDGVTTVFALSSNPGHVANMDVSISGSTKRPTLDYTLSGNLVTFTSAPASATNNILIRYGQGIIMESAQQEYRLTASGGETAIDLPFTYEPGAANLVVYQNGLRLYTPTHYAETDSNTVTLTSAAVAADVFLFVAGAQAGEGSGAAATTELPAQSGNANKVLKTDGGAASWTDEPKTKTTAKAWVSFKGTGTVAINSAYNVSSITDNGTGDYTINFTSALADANYCVVGINNGSLGGAGVQIKSAGIGAAPTLKTTTQVRIIVGDGTSLYDAYEVTVAVFGL